MNSSVLPLEGIQIATHASQSNHLSTTKCRYIAHLNIAHHCVNFSMEQSDKESLDFWGCSPFYLKLQCYHLAQ